LLLTVSDITQRRQAEEAQRQSEEKFRQLAENIRQVFWLRERVSGKIIYISPAYEAIWGRERSDLYANPSAFLENVHPEDLQRVLAAQKAQHEKGQLFNQQFRLIRPDGQMRWIWARTFPVYNTNGLVIRYAGLADDITEARRSEEILLARLRLQEFSMTCSLDALMQRIMDEICVLVDSPIGFFHFLQEDQKTLTLQAWSTRTVQEFCTAEAKGHTYEVAKAGVWVDCIEARQPVIHNDYASLPHRKGLPEGHAALIRQLVVPIFRCDQIVAILGVGNKAYDYNQADADIISRLADFAWDILERRRTEIALQESLAENQLLLRELQHRVKNSMGMIASIVSLETFGAAHPAVTEALESLHRRILTMANLYTHLYDSGNTQTVRLDQYIQQIVHSLETAFVGDVHGGTIQAHLDEVTVNVRAASPFGLIVNELVTNALKYAFPASQRGTIIVRLQHADGALTLQVQDDGIGLPDDFDIARSTGLGMQLVQGLSGQLGGALTYESKRGAIFRLRIPMHTLV
jgi:PAS domain S-box-containing protein